MEGRKGGRKVHQFSVEAKVRQHHGLRKEGDKGRKEGRKEGKVIRKGYKGRL